MHANLCPHVTRTLSHNTHIPIPNPSGHTPCLPVKPAFILKTFDPYNHTAVTFPIKNHAMVGNQLGCSSGKDYANPEQQHYLKQLADPPDDKDEREVNTMADYASDLKLVFSHVGEDTMSDDENDVVNETPGVHE